MERVDRPSTLFFSRQLEDTSVELHLEPQLESFSIIPYVFLENRQGPYVKKARLQGIPSSVAFTQPKQATQVLQQAIIHCREYLSDPVVEVFPRGLGGMEQGVLLKKTSKSSSTTEPQHQSEESSSDLPPLIDEEETKPSNSNTVAPLRQIPLTNLEKIIQRLGKFTIPEKLRGKGLYNIALNCSNIENLRSAIPLWQLSLKLARFSEDRIVEGMDCSILGYAYYRLGEYRRAIDYYENHLAIATELEDRAGEGSAYSGLGSAYIRLGEYRRAVDYHEKNLAIAKELEDRDGEGMACGYLGHVYCRLGEYRHAIDCHENQLDIAKELEDRSGEGSAYSGLGNAYDSLGEYRRAIDYHEKHLAIAKELKDRDGEGMACGYLGHVYCRLGEYRLAIDCHENQLDIAKELEDRSGEGSAYSGLGNAYDSLGEYRRAVDYHEKQLAIAKELEDREGEERAYSGLGNAYQGLGEYRRAIVCHEIILTIAKEFEDRAGEGSIYCNLGNAYQGLGDYRRAIDCYEKALVIAKELEDRDGEGRAYGNLGVAYQNLGEYRLAIDYQEKRLAIAKEFEDRAGEGGAYANIGCAHTSLGEYRRAIDYHEKHLGLAKEFEDRAGIGTAYGNLGNAYERLGEYRRAIDYHEKHLAFAKELEDRAGVGKAYCNLGNAYDSIGEYRRAIDYYENQLAIARELEDRAGEGSAYGNLGNAYVLLGEHRQAINYHEKRLAIATEVEDRAGKGMTCGNLGNAYYSLGEYRRAIDYHEKCLEIAKEVEDRDGEGRAYGNLGNAYNGLGEYRRAIEYHERRLAIAKDIEDRAGEGIAHSNMGLAYLKEGKLSSSEEHFRQAVACYGVLQEDLGAENQGWQISIFERQSTAYLQLKDVLIAQGKIDEALALADFGRSRALTSFLSRNRRIAAKEPFSVEEIQALAIRHKTTFLQYSFDYSDPKVLYAWTVSPSGEIAFHKLNADMLKSTQVSDSLSALAPTGIREACVTGLECLADSEITRETLYDRSFDRETAVAIPTTAREMKEFTRRFQFPGGVLSDNVGGRKQSPSASLDLARAANAKGQWRSLTRMADELEHEALRQNDADLRLTALIYLAMGYNALGDGGAALPYAESAHALAVKAGEGGAVGRALREKAFAYCLNGQTEQAIPLAKEALALAQEHDDSEGESVALRVLGTVALESYGAALSSDDANSNSPSKKTSPEQSLPLPIECFYKALIILRRSANVVPSEEMRILRGFAKACEQADQLGKALPCYNLALKIAKSLNLTQEIAAISAARKRLVPFLREQTHRLLSECYQVLIAPLEQHLTPDSRITLIPDSGLNTLPFAIFKDPEGNYLIEKYTLSTVPSMEVLQELELMEGRAPPSQSALIVGDPQENLAYSAWEAEKLGKLFETPPLIGSKATLSAVIKQATEARFLHFSCHGNASFKTHPNSVFEGAVALASEGTNLGWLHAEQIQKLPLKAELAFLSACKSGRGKLQGEGVIGLTRSFLAAGVPSVIATHWSIPDGDCTVKIAQAFYSHILRKTPEAQEFEGELGKDEILRQVLLDLIDESPELREHPEKWGAFFLLGRP